MPVVWWSTNGTGDFSNHYMNIFGYEMWERKDSSGNTNIVKNLFKYNIFFKWY